MISGARLGVVATCLYISILPTNLSPGGSGNAGGPVELVLAAGSLTVFDSLSLLKKVTFEFGCAADENSGCKPNCC